MLDNIQQIFGKRATAIQPIDDNWIELVAGWLTDPVLKLRLWTTNGKEYERNGANLHLKYEPAIDPDHLRCRRLRRQWKLGELIRKIAKTKFTLRLWLHQMRES